MRTDSVECLLCPNQCVIPEGRSGDCRARVNISGKLITPGYSAPCAIHIDPVEKKPLYHFLPGSRTFSLAVAGCNLHCLNCQNWQISQKGPWETDNYTGVTPEHITEQSLKNKCASVSFTYTEPSVHPEYVIACAEKTRAAGLKNIMVTNGYMNPEPARTLYRFIDASNTDIKSMDEDFYRSVCSASLMPVLATLIIQKKLNVWIEITNLVLPGLNDSDVQFKKLAKWVKENLGNSTPVHFSRFFPLYRMKNLPPTPAETLFRARGIAVSEGLSNVYIGNIHPNPYNNTDCLSCKRTVIERTGYTVGTINIKNGRCGFCNKEIKGVWNDE